MNTVKNVVAGAAAGAIAGSKGAAVGAAAAHHSGHGTTGHTTTTTTTHSTGGMASQLNWTEKITTNERGLSVVDGVTGVRQVSHHGPVYGSGAKRVEMVDGTTPRHAAVLDAPTFDIYVASRSDSVDEIAFPSGAVEIEQHYYKGHVMEEHYGEVNHKDYEDVVIKEIPVYKKEVDEIIVRNRVVNTIVERVPKFNYIDNVVEVEHIVERPIYREVPVKKTVIKQVPKPVREQRLIEKVRYVPVTQEVEVERIVEIPGEVVVQPRHVVRDEMITTDKHLDKEVPVVVSQVVAPIMKDTKKKVRVPAKVLSPDLHTNQVRVPKPVELEFQQTEVDTKFRWTHLTEAEYNSAFFQLNQHLTAEHRRALTPNHHLYVDETTGFPIIRDSNLRFYRLGDEVLEHLEGYHTNHVESSSVSSTSDITTTHASTAHVAVRTGHACSSSDSVSVSGRRKKPVNRTRHCTHHVSGGAEVVDHHTTGMLHQEHHEVHIHNLPNTVGTAGHRYVTQADSPDYHLTSYGIKHDQSHMNRSRNTVINANTGKVMREPTAHAGVMRTLGAHDRVIDETHAAAGHGPFVTGSTADPAHMLNAHVTVVPAGGHSSTKTVHVHGDHTHGVGGIAIAPGTVTTGPGLAVNGPRAHGGHVAHAGHGAHAGHAAHGQTTTHTTHTTTTHGAHGAHATHGANYGTTTTTHGAHGAHATHGVHANYGTQKTSTGMLQGAIAGATNGAMAGAGMKPGMAVVH